MKQVSLRRKWLGKAKQRYKDKKVKATAERWSCMRQVEWSKWVVARCCHGWRWWSKRDWRAKVPASSGTFQRRSSNCLRVDRFEKINLSKSPWARTQRNHDFAEELQSPNLRQRKGVCLSSMAEVSCCLGFLARIFRFGFFLFAYKPGWWCIRLSDFFFPTVTPNHLIVSFPDVLSFLLLASSSLFLV